MWSPAGMHCGLPVYVHEALNKHFNTNNFDSFTRQISKALEKIDENMLLSFRFCFDGEMYRAFFSGKDGKGYYIIQELFEDNNSGKVFLISDANYQNKEIYFKKDKAIERYDYLVSNFDENYSLETLQAQDKN